MGFDRPPVVPERRVHADVGDRVVLGFPDLDTHRVHTVRQQNRAARQQVGGRKPDFPSAAESFHHAPAERVRLAEQCGDLPYPAGLQQRAHLGAAHLTAADRDRPDDLDLEAPRLRQVGEQGGVSGPVAAEAEIMADEDLFHPDRVEQTVPYESFRRLAGEVEPEALQNHAIDAQCRDPAQLLAQTQNQGDRPLRSENRERMRMKRHGQRGPAPGAGVFDHAAENRPVAQMDAVEVPQADDGMWKPCGAPDVTDDLHARAA